MEILSNFGSEKIVDCVQEVIDKHNESEPNNKEFLKYTMADTVVNELGIEVPRECQMTDHEEFGLK